MPLNGIRRLQLAEIQKKKLKGATLMKAQKELNAKGTGKAKGR